MRVLDRIEQVRKELESARSDGRRVGLVPTMGALHAGHASLIERSARGCDVTAVTVFVNPLQFGPTEDFARYPRDLAADAAAAEAAGADLVFAPPVDEMYPGGRALPETRVEVGRLGEVLEGAVRPGHFSGVATVVAKLFAVAGPCRAYFGEKDYQQLLVVRQVAADLSFPVEVVACPTVREADGLALSSRNRYLSGDERLAATVLWRALATAAASGERDGGRLRELMARYVSSEPDVELDYAEVADPLTLAPVATVEGEARLLIAARVGTTRLIDNLAVTP
ncbi:MAG: pantoate--beta-alanine ligase [Acidimicrobiia bacterium]